MTNVTQLLQAVEQGDAASAEQLLPLVYEELRSLAARNMAHEKAGHTLDATALVHEAYVRLVGPAQSQHWDGRSHFFGAAAEAMRRILIENARRKKRIKHGGELQRVQSDALGDVTERVDDNLLAIDEALDDLAAVDPRAAQVVKLHFFAGLTLDEVARLLEASVRTVHRDWAFARAWLAKRIGEQQT